MHVVTDDLFSLLCSIPLFVYSTAFLSILELVFWKQFPVLEKELGYVTAIILKENCCFSSLGIKHECQANGPEDLNRACIAEKLGGSLIVAFEGCPV